MTPKSRYSPSFSNYIALFTIFVVSTTAAAASSRKISYANHCGSVVPQSSSTSTFLNNFLEVFDGHFSGGEKLFAADPDSSPDFTDGLDVGSFNFQTDYIRKTKSHETIQLGGSLSFGVHRIRVKNNSIRRAHRISYFVPLWKGNSVYFKFSGFWSETTGMLCMVGTGSSYNYKNGKSLDLSAVFKLNYPKISNISTSIVRGTVESLDSADSPNYFQKISVSAYAQKNYSYMDFPESTRDSCSNVKVPKETRSFEVDSVGSYIPNLLAVDLKLEHESGCNGGSCYPFSLKIGSTPSFLSLSQITFSGEGKFHTRVLFYNHTTRWFNSKFTPEESLVGEGFWDHEKNQMCLVACQVLADASVGDCTIGMSLWFPLVLTIKSKSQVIGSLWSTKNKNDPAYFGTMSFRAFHGIRNPSPGMKYKYTMLDGASGCDAINNTADLGPRTYPDGSSSQDMSFSMISRTKGESFAWGQAYPLSIGDNTFADSFAETPFEGVNVTMWNVSYDISYRFQTNSSSPSENKTLISAEGLYNSSNGHLCMVGCMSHHSSALDNQAKIEDSMDCNILINVQFPPMDPKEGGHLNATVRSTRQTSDPLYFEPLLFSSYRMYNEQATKSIERMDIEIIMVVISLTLSCVFISSQILHAKKHRDLLPAISITMLVAMTPGYLIPLILNFEALLIMIQNKQNFFFRSTEWMVVKEVTAGVLTLVAFVLHLRMLQLAWSARRASEGKKDLSDAEQRTMKLCLVLYLVGAMIAWFVQSWSRSHWWRWEDLFTYAGFILDGFLLPQIMFNLFQRSQEKALSLAFYVGMTALRIFPHFYDLYRAHNNLPHFQSSYIYASPKVDFFSLSWNIIIPLAGILFATLIFMQQRFGGDCIFPSRLRRKTEYATIAELSL